MDTGPWQLVANHTRMYVAALHSFLIWQMQLFVASGRQDNIVTSVLL